MTDDEAKALGLRAVACAGWRRMPGMLERHARNTGAQLRLGFEGPNDFACVMRQPETGPAIHGNRFGVGWPDFRDPATLGCLLALVREACESAGRDVEIDAGTRASCVVIWRDHDEGTDARSDGPLAELLVCALETLAKPGANA